MKLCLSAGLMLLLSWAAVGQQSLSDGLTDAIAKAEKNGFSGVLVVTGESGPLVLTAGMADFENDKAITVDAAFRLGAATELFTAALVLELVDDGYFGLESRLSEVGPEFRLPYAASITVLDLLQHTSGIAPADGSLENYLTTHEMIQSAQAARDDREPGTYRYSAANYIILGAIVEKFQLELWKYLTKDKLIKPLELKHTDEHEKGQLIDGLTIGYAYDGKERFPVRPLHIENLNASGSLYSTATDFHHFHQQLINGALKGSTFCAEIDGGAKPLPPSECLDSGRRRMDCGAATLAGHTAVYHPKFVIMSNAAGSEKGGIEQLLNALDDLLPAE